MIYAHFIIIRIFFSQIRIARFYTELSVFVQYAYRTWRHIYFCFINSVFVRLPVRYFLSAGNLGGFPGVSGICDYISVFSRILRCKGYFVIERIQSLTKVHGYIVCHTVFGKSADFLHRRLKSAERCVNAAVALCVFIGYNIKCISDCIDYLINNIVSHFILSQNNRFAAAVNNLCTDIFRHALSIDQRSSVN